MIPEDREVISKRMADPHSGLLLMLAFFKYSEADFQFFREKPAMSPQPLHQIAPMAAPIRVGVVGLGRMGIIHALHIHELAQESGLCKLAAVSTMERSRADLFLGMSGARAPVFDTIYELEASNLCDVTIIATNTELHREHALIMIQRGHRVFLEKPLTGTMQGDRSFASQLEQQYPNALMLGFQRRFDLPLLTARNLIREGRIGRVFKVFSALEDSSPAPDGFQSPGILPDMGIHNVDEVLWLTDRVPKTGMVIGSRIFSHRHTTCEEDFDDALMVLDFGDELVAHVQVSRNHVSGYRGETVIYGEKGQIQIGRFCQQPHDVLLEVHGAQGSSQPPQTTIFPMRRYDQALPEFIGRFGNAYKQELRTFLECCCDGKEFPVTHRDALRAQEVVAGAMSGIVTDKDMTSIEYLRIS
jgi:myo-inositol 2-dehydrogenase/D-chiro-inositol 1-dehydrogenase